MPYRILTLISRVDEYRLDNHSIIPNALRSCGHDTWVGDIETLSMHDSTICCDMFEMLQPFPAGVPFPEMALSTASAEEFDLVWVLTNPLPDALLDCYELLWVLNQKVPFVNRAESMLMLNSKTALPAVVDRLHLPEQYVSNRFDTLDTVVRDQPGSAWILKPANEGCGADVFYLAAAERNYRALLQSATGNETTRYEMYGRPTIGLSRRYVAMQRFAPNVVENEKRVMIAGGVPFCGFRRFHHSEDHRANVTLGNAFEGLSLTSDEDTYCRELGRRLMDYGIYFVGLDLAFPYVLELNLANPGGLNYSMRATGIDQSEEAIHLLLGGLESDGVLSPVINSATMSTSQNAHHVD